jgi:tetraacyldisaccharide 4'-kinase
LKSASGSRRFLWPLSVLYSLAARARVWCYARGIFRARKLPGTVISVGNLTVGGTGKTPMVLWIAERLAEEGKRTAILTRGYRGTIDARTNGEPQSDEVALLRERLSGKVQIGVGANRYKKSEVLARHGTEWFVLDDGFQHLPLARDADVVLIDATDPFGGGATLPAGRLREPISALQRADVVVITRSVQAPAPAIEAMIRRHTKSSIFYASTKLESVLRVPPLVVAMPPQDWPRGRFAAFCGIGNPSAFFEDLRRWGFHVVGERSFPDHHVYAPREMDELEHLAASCGADALLCTEKDVWNLRHVQFTAVPVYCCRISLELPAKEFRDAITAAVSRRQGQAAR